MNKCVALMPLSKYKRKELYRHVETFELADPSVFEDAAITKNLCICTLKKENTDRYTWQDLVLKSVDQRYIEYYEWNIKHNRNIKGLFVRRSDSKSVSYFDTSLDFLETSRCFADVSFSGSGFGKGGFGYRWNILHDYSSVNAHILQIRMPSERARDNLAIVWYNGKKGESFIVAEPEKCQVFSLAYEWLKNLQSFQKILTKYIETKKAVIGTHCLFLTETIKRTY